MSGSSSRVSIPNNLSKTIQNLKEIAKNHGEDEIYAMLRDCNMDPNETAQKLLFQDPFHEVKRKRDKRKENNREPPADAKWRPVSQGRMGRGGWGNYPSHYTSHDAGGVGNFGKENEINQSSKKGIRSSSSPASRDIENKSAIPTSSSDPLKIQRPVSVQGSTPTDSSVNRTILVKENLGVIVTNKTRKSATGGAKRPVSMRRVSTSSNYLSSSKLDKGPGVYTSASDPVLVSSLGECIPSTVDAIKREVGGRRITVDATTKKIVSPDVSGSELSSLNGKGSTDMYNSFMHEKVQGKFLGFDGNQFSDASQATHPLSRTSSAGSRPSSNYSNRSQQLNGLSKVGPVKEWKPKATNAKPARVSLKLQTTDVGPTTQEASPCSSPASSSVPLDEPTSKLQSKLEELQFSDSKHVIIPSHLQVPESERTGLSFGSFDANFGLATNIVNDTGSEVGSAELSESSQAIMESAEEPTSSIQIASPSGQEAEMTDCSQSPAKMPENNTLSTDHPKSPAARAENLTSREPDILSIVPTAQEHDQSTAEAAPVPDSSQYSVHTAPTYSNFGLVPQMLGNQVTTFEGAEPQARDATHIPSFLVQQPFDAATSYYTSMYRPTSGDGDGHFSPFFAPGPATKYSGNIAILPSQTGQMQESGNSLVLPSTGPAPLITQAASAMQSSVTVSQQSVPLFRQPPGVHISHYPPSYLPYSQYFPPFYIPSPSMPPFLSNAAFPQQPPTGNVYPGVPGSATVKYPISQYKPVTNVGNSNHIGMVTGYGTYNPSPVTTACSTGSEDLATSLYKENNVYIADQQSEGSAWIPTPGREISAMHATSFYNLPAQVQHMAFPGIYHHATPTVAANTVHPMLQQSQAPAGAVEMAGPPSGGVYQQPQRTQINWVNNY